MKKQPHLTLERNNTGRLFIGVLEFDDQGYGVRTYVLADQSEHVADVVMERRFRDMVRLTQGNVTSEDLSCEGSRLDRGE